MMPKNERLCLLYEVRVVGDDATSRRETRTTKYLQLHPQLRDAVPENPKFVSSECVDDALCIARAILATL